MSSRRHTAVYPGSFDPVTNGHLDIARRSLSIFDRLVIAVLDHPAKQGLFTVEERVALLRESLADEPRIEIRSFAGLLVDLLESVKATTIIRGLRFLSDFEYELQMALMNQSLSGEVETIFMVANPERTFVSSSLVKEVARLGRSIDQFVPPPVVAALKEKYS
jgi:pantetheine-phosphate adenylyltransferase